MIVLDDSGIFTGISIFSTYETSDQILWQGKISKTPSIKRQSEANYFFANADSNFSRNNVILTSEHLKGSALLQICCWTKNERLEQCGWNV